MEIDVRQLRGLVGSLQMLMEGARDWSQLLAANPSLIRKLATPPFFWAEFYDWPFGKQLGLLLYVGGSLPVLQRCLDAEDSIGAALEAVRSEQIAEWNGGPDQRFEPKHLFGLIYSFHHSIGSMVTWCKWLNELVDDVRSGDDGALFKAVSIDRTIAACPTIADRITLAEYDQDEAFFRRLRNALRGKPRKPKEEYAELRYLLYTLEQTGQLDDLTQEDAYRLFCEELQLYPTDAEDPARSLWQFISRWKKARQST